MSMQLRVVHTTRFVYDGKAAASYNHARLTPVTTPEQIVVHTRLEVSPQSWSSEYRDYWGSQVIAFEVLDPHESMTVTATSTVQVTRPVPAPAATTWEQLATREVADRWTEYLMLPPLVAPPEDLAERARAVAADAETPGAAARALCDLVRAEVDYVTGATDAHTTATQAWEQRAGVCQDMVHVVIGALRTIGVPARYVSGYFHPHPDPVVGESVAGASHAWVEWWEDGWHPYDVTNGELPGDRYVVVATGRDYDDVRPLSGIFSGARTSGLDVAVELTRLS